VTATADLGYVLDDVFVDHRAPSGPVISQAQVIPSI
jgi:hypothetical protein